MKLLPLALLLAAGLSAANISFYTDRGAFTTASTISLTDDFSTVTPNIFGAGFSRNGIAYTPLTSDIGIASPGYSNFGAGVEHPTADFIVTSNGNEDFLASFSTPYTAVGLNVYLNGAGAPSISFFDGSNSLVGMYTFGSAANDREFIGIRSDTAIASFRWLGVGGGNVNTGFSYVTVGEANATPEPGTVALFLVGLAMAGTRRKR